MSNGWCKGKIRGAVVSSTSQLTLAHFYYSPLEDNIEKGGCPKQRSVLLAVGEQGPDDLCLGAALQGAGHLHVPAELLQLRDLEETQGLSFVPQITLCTWGQRMSVHAVTA